MGSLDWSNRSDCETGTAGTGTEEETDDDTKKAPMKSASLTARGVSFMVVRGS